MKQCLSTWSRFKQIDRNRPASAFHASSSNEGKPGGRNPARLRLASWRSSRDQSDASVNPHHDGGACINEETVAILVTRITDDGICRHRSRNGVSRETRRGRTRETISLK